MATNNKSQLDPEVRERLLQEARAPWRGLRRAIWFALLASAGLGLATMSMRLASGNPVNEGDLLIQFGALALFTSLLWFDRGRA